MSNCLRYSNITLLASRTAKMRHVGPAAVNRFVTEHWPLCQARRCMLVDDEFSIVRGI